MIKDSKIDWTYFNNKSGIYKITNIVNGKLYIGATSGFSGRCGNHKRELKNGNEHNPHLRNAYKKYGSDKFIYTPILVCEETELERYEIALIKLYRTQDRKIGYNVTPGGMRICGKDHHMFGKKQSAKWIAMISKRMSGKNNPFYGKRLPCIDSSIKVNSIPVIQLDMKGNFIKEFSSITEAAKEVGVVKSALAHCCKGFQGTSKRITSAGYRWKYKKDNAGIPVGG